METKHTPGPWSVAIGDGCFVVETNDAFIRFVIHGSNQEGDEANARLIAAAPDLLDALCMVLDDPDALDGRPLTYECVRAAIAKATGETS
jgi:hypothetical protein